MSASTKVEQALQGLISIDDLSDDEQEAYLDKFDELLSAPSALEDAFFKDRQERGLGVGMDEAGNLIYGENEKTKSANTDLSPSNASSEQDQRQAADNFAVASMALEGLVPNEKSDVLAKQFVNGEITIEQEISALTTYFAKCEIAYKSQS